MPVPQDAPKCFAQVHLKALLPEALAAAQLTAGPVPPQPHTKEIN